MTEKKQSAAKRAKAKLLRRPVGVIVMRAILCDKGGRPITGEIVGVLAPQHPIDYRSLRERGFSVGTQLRAQIDRDRNPGFWRKAHVLGGWLADNVEEFHGCDMHSALKKLQEKSSVGVSTEEFDIPGFGKGTRTVAESLNFSDMDEGRFNELWNGWVEWLCRNAWPGLEPSTVDVVEELISGNQQ